MWEAFFENPASVYLACEIVAKEVGLDTIDVRRDGLKALEAGARPSKKKVEEVLNAVRTLF